MTITILGETFTFNTLEDYLNYLESEWKNFRTQLYTLEDYLAMGKFVWQEKPD